MKFCFEHFVPVASDRVFSFFENPKRLEVLHAGWSRTRVLHHETQVRVGAETWVEMLVGGFIPMVCGFRHTLFEPPARFGEEAIHGSFTRFTHVHEFVPKERGTVVRDLLEICLPWYYGGEVVVRQVVAPMIRRIFQNRAARLSRLAADGTLASFAPRYTSLTNAI